MPLPKDDEKQREIYERKLKEAEELAAKSTDYASRIKWLQVAEGYRYLVSVTGEVKL